MYRQSYNCIFYCFAMIHVYRQYCHLLCEMTELTLQGLTIVYPRRWKIPWQKLAGKAHTEAFYNVYSITFFFHTPLPAPKIFALSYAWKIVPWYMASAFSEKDFANLPSPSADVSVMISALCPITRDVYSSWPNTEHN